MKISRKPFTADEWAQIDAAFAKAIRVARMDSGVRFTAEELIRIHTIIYNSCYSGDYLARRGELYKRFRELIDDYCLTEVMSALEEDVPYIGFLRELVRQWSIFRALVKLHCKLFHHLNSCYCLTYSVVLPGLEDSCFRSFAKHVYANDVVQRKLMDARNYLVQREVYMQLEAGFPIKALGTYEDIEEHMAPTSYETIVELYTNEDAPECYVLQLSQALKAFRFISFYWSGSKLLELVYNKQNGL